jgi:DNA replication initiation complex subunit (GINS family)
MNTIIIELCKEDRDRLDGILAALKERPNCTACVERVIEAFNHLATEKAPDAPQTTETDTAEPVTLPEVETPTEAPETADAPVAEPTEEREPVKREDVQRKVVELSSAGKKAEVRDIVKAYADKVSAIPEDKLAEVFDKLTALEG